MNKFTIDRLSPGQSAVVESVRQSPLSDRLRDLGITPGTPVRCVLRAPLGDPAAYLVRGALIALRREDGRTVSAREAPHG